MGGGSSKASAMMASSSSAANVFQVFNNKLIDFVDDLKGAIGHLPEYSLISSSATFLAKFQERQNYAMFDRYIAQPYGESILARDEAFLLTQNYSNSNGGIVDLIKGVWKDLPAGDRESVWAHLHVLLVLAARCRAVA